MNGSTFDMPCMTAYCIHHNTYDPGISPGSANQCILGDVYLRSNLSRELYSMLTSFQASERWQKVLLILEEDYAVARVRFNLTCH